MPTYDGRQTFRLPARVRARRELYVTLGERSDAPMRPQAQQLDSDMGKILRINPDGSVPNDNPFAGRPEARPEIWSLGHRNVQAAGFDSRGPALGRRARHQRRGRAESDREGEELRLAAAGLRRGVLRVSRSPARPPPRTGTSSRSTTGTRSSRLPALQFYTGDAFPAWQRQPLRRMAWGHASSCALSSTTIG